MGLYHWSRRQILSKVWLVRVTLLIFLVAIMFLVGIKVVIPVFGSLYRGTKMLWADLPQTEDRTNFLILGVGGGVHEGPDLTDSMMVLSVRRRDGFSTLISVPRDLWVDSLRAKINTAYHYGEEKQNGGGFILAKSAIFETLNLPIHKVLLIDFSVFENIIDALGGVDVNVRNAFFDKEYPIAGKENDLCDGDIEYRCRYETIKFEKGVQHMNGMTALKFVRSRHAEGDEGTDFARSKRQEEIITAVKKKISYKNVKKLYDIFLKKVKTDILFDESIALTKLALKINRNSIRSINITEPAVYNPPISAQYDYQWVLVSKNVPDFIFRELEK